jgi:hypothetical protein
MEVVVLQYYEILVLLRIEEVKHILDALTLVIENHGLFMVIMKIT